MWRKLIGVCVSLAIVLTAPGMGAWVAANDAAGGGNKAGKPPEISTRDLPPPRVDMSEIDAILRKLNNPDLAKRTSPEKLREMREKLKKYKDALENSGTDETRAALAKLKADLDNGDKDLELSLGEAFDDLSPFLRKINDASNVTTVLDRTDKTTTVRVANWQNGGTQFIQKSIELNPVTTRKIIYRPDLDEFNRRVIDAIVIETKKGSATEQRVVYNRRIELLLKNLKRLFYDQTTLARRITENCVVGDLYDKAKRLPNSQITVRQDRADEQMGPVACQKMVQIFDAKRQPLDKEHPRGFPMEMLAYLEKLAKAREADALDQLDWRELQSIQRKAMQFYNDEQLKSMQKMVLIELKTYFAQVTNAQVKEDKETASLDATMKDLSELQKTFDEFKKGNFQGYSLLMTTIFAKADIEDPRYVSKDIMLLASEAFADVANAFSAQQRMLKGGMTAEEIDATIEESQQWLRLAQIHLQEFDMHTLSIQLERLESGHLRDHMGLRTDDIEFKDADGNTVTLGAAENAEQAKHLAEVARKQYLPKLDQISSELKVNLIKQALAGFYLTYGNVTRAMLYDDTMVDRVASMGGKLKELKDLYLSTVFDRVKKDPRFQGVIDPATHQRINESAKLQGNLFELFIKRLPSDNAAEYKISQDLEALMKRFKDLGQIQSAERVRGEIQPLYEEFARLARLIMQEANKAGKDKDKKSDDSMPIIDDVKKEAQNLSVRQSEIFKAVGDFSSQARMFDMVNELDLYACKFASSDYCYSKGDTFMSKTVGMKWWDHAMSWITGGFAGYSLRDHAIEGTMKRVWLTEKAFKTLGANKEERYRIMKLLAQGKFQEAIERLAKLDPNHYLVEAAINSLNAGVAKGAYDQLDKLLCSSAQRDAIRQLIKDGKFKKAIAALRKLDSALKALDDYEADKALEDPFEALDFDGSLAKLPENKTQIMAQGVIQSQFAQLQHYIMGYTLTSAVYDTFIVSAMTLGLGAVSRFAIAGAKVMIAVGDTFSVMKGAESVAALQKLNFLFRYIAYGLRFMANIPSITITYAGKWLESSMISIRNVLGISGIGEKMRFRDKAWILVRKGGVNALKFSGKNSLIMAGASAGIQGVSYGMDREGSQFKSVGEAMRQGAASGVGFGAKSSLFMLMSPVPVSAFREGAVGNVVRGLANSPGPMSSLTQGIAKIVATDGEIAAMGPLGALKQASLTFSPWGYGAAKLGVWTIAMVDGAMKYMLASAIFHNVGSLYGYYSYKLGHKKEEAEGKEEGGASVELNAITQGEATGMTAAELSWLLLPVHQQSADKAVKDQISREDGFKAAINQGLASEMAQMKTGTVKIEVTWGVQTWRERAVETFKKGWSAVTRGEYTPGKRVLTIDADLRARANKFEMKDMTEAQLLDIATSPREQNGKYRLKAELGTNFGAAEYSTGPIRPEGETGKVEKFNILISDEARDTAKKLLIERIKGGNGEALRLEALRADKAGGELVFNKGLTDSKGNSLEVKVSGDRLKEFAKMAAVTGTGEQSTGEKGSYWQKIKDMIKGRPVETGGGAIVRNMKDGVSFELSEPTAKEAAAARESGEKLSEQGAGLLEKAKNLQASPQGADGVLKEIEDAVAGGLERTAKVEEAAKRLNDPKLQQEAVDIAESLRKALEAAKGPDFTRRMNDAAKLEPAAEGVKRDKETAKELRKAETGLTTIAQSLESAGKRLWEAGTRLEAAETAPAVIRSVTGQMEERIKTKMTESARERAAGDVKGADKLELQALELEVLRRSLEADAFLEFVNEKMGKEFTEFQAGRGSKERVDRAIDLFVETWEKGVFGELWATGVETVVNEKGEKERKWKIPEEYRFVGKDGNKENFIPEFRGPQKAMLKEVLMSMAEGEKMTMGLLRTSGGKTLLSFVLLSFMDTMARQKGKQGAVYITVNADLVAQAYEDYRGFFNGRDPRFQIRTVSDFMADQAMADSTGGLSPFKSHDVVFDEFDLLGTITALSLGSGNGGLSSPNLDPFQRALRGGAMELREQFFKTYGPLIGKNVSGERLVEMIERPKSEPEKAMSKGFKDLRDKYVNILTQAIDQVRSPEFKAALLALKEPVFDYEHGTFSFKDSGLTREQFQKKYEMSPEQLYKQMRKEHDHAFGSGWRGLWDVGVIERQQGGLEGYVTKTFLGGVEAMSKPDLAKFFDAELDPSGKKLVQYHNDVPLDNLDTLWRTFLQAEHGLPLELDFDNLTVVDFARLNRAAKESNATLVALSGTLPKELESFMRDLGWNILGKPAAGQGLDYQKVDPLRQGVRAAISFIRENATDKAMARIDELGLPKEVRDSIHDLITHGKLEEAAAKLTKAAPANTVAHEAVASIRQVADQPAKVKEAIELIKAGKVKETDIVLRDMGLDKDVREKIKGLVKSAVDEKDARAKDAKLKAAIEALAGRAGRGGRNLSFLYVDSKANFENYKAEMDALDPKRLGDKAAVEKYEKLDARSKAIAAEMKRLRGDPNAAGQLAKLKEEYKDIEGELDPLRTVPRSRRHLAVTPDSNFLRTEWLSPELVEGNHLQELKDGEIDVVILIGQSGFRGLDLPFKKAYVNGHIAMFVPDPGSLSTVNRRQLTGRIDLGRMPKGATSRVIGLVLEDALLQTDGYRTMAVKKISEVATGGAQSIWKGIEGRMQEHLGAGQSFSEEAVTKFLSAPDPMDDPEYTRDLGNVGRMYREVKLLEELGKVVTVEEAAEAMKDKTGDKLVALGTRDAVAQVLLHDAAIQDIMADMQAKEERKSLEASGILKKPEPNALQRFLSHFRSAPKSGPVLAPAN